MSFFYTTTFCPRCNLVLRISYECSRWWWYSIRKTKATTCICSYIKFHTTCYLYTSWMTWNEIRYIHINVQKPSRWYKTWRMSKWLLFNAKISNILAIHNRFHFGEAANLNCIVFGLNPSFTAFEASMRAVTRMIVLCKAWFL